MKRSLARRLSDAICAFRTGHSRRDLDRVRMRRFRLLGDRLAMRDERRSVDAGAWPHLGERYSDLAHTVRDLTDRVVVGRERIREAALLKHFELDRACLLSRRRNELLDWKPVERAANVDGSHVEAAPVPSPKLYGKLYEGLLEKRLLDLFLERACLCCGNCHRFLRSFLGERLAGSPMERGHE